MINLHLHKEIFNDVYLPYLNDTHKYFVCYGGSGSGKSVFIAQRLIIKAVNSVRRILIIRKTLVSQKESCWKLITDLLKQWKIYNYCTINKSDYTITFPNGSQMIFKGIDDPERIKSIAGVTDCWCEEATELTEDDYTQLTLRLRACDDTQFFISFNPTSKANWVYKRWFAPEAIIYDDTIILKTTYKDNKFLPQDYIDNLEHLIKTNPTYYKIYALGDFCTLDRLVYNNWHVDTFDYKELHGEHIVGLDFGFSADTTALVESIVVDDKIYIFREWGDVGYTNPQIANVIKSMGLSKSLIIADSAEPKSIVELKTNGCKVKESVKGPDSIIHGIQQLQQYEIIVHPNCEQTITELQNYTWQKDKQTGEYINKPIDSFNHYLDALRYSLQCMQHRIRTINKNILGI